MACRIGMTTNPDVRMLYWESVYPTLRDWQILAGPFVYREQAQKMETQLAKEHKCEAHAGGDEPDVPDAFWYVYKFNY